MDDHAPDGWPEFEKVRAQALLAFDEQCTRDGGLRRFTITQAFDELAVMCWDLYSTVWEGGAAVLRTQGLAPSTFIRQVQVCADRGFLDVYGYPEGEPGRLGIIVAALPIPGAEIRETGLMLVRVNAQSRSARKLKDFETAALSEAARERTREEHLQVFLASRPISIATVRRAARVYKPEMQQWRKDLLPDDSKISRRIEDVLAGRTPLDQ